MSFSSAMITASMATLVFLLEPAAAISETLNFLVEPRVGQIQVNPMLNVTFECQVNSTSQDNSTSYVHTYQPMWTIYYPNLNQYLSTHDDKDKQIIEDHGIYYYSGERAANITIPGTVENNRTQVWCTALHAGETKFSDQIEIIIPGVPLPPSPNLKVLSSSQLELQWEIPYSHESYPVQRYDIQIFNASSGHKFDNNVTQNKYVHNSVDGNTATQCDLLIFTITAVSELGKSAPAEVSGGFPIVPQSFPSEINVAVTFYGNGTPIVAVTFEAPFICDYQTSNLTMTIEDVAAVTHDHIPALIHHFTYNGRNRMISETFDSGLLANHTYTLTISTSDSAFVEDVSTAAAVNFSTTLVHFNTQCLGYSSGLQLRDVAAFAGGVLVVLLVTIIISVISIVYSRKSKLRKAPGSTMDLMLNGINKNRASGRMSGSQYDTPYKSCSSLYETIDGYQKHTPAHCRASSTQSAWQQQQQHQWKPQLCNLESKRSKGDAIETATLYQEMHSAAVSESGLQVNGHNPSCHVHVTKSQHLQLVSPHNHGHPLKLHACRVELHAAPASTTAGIGTSASESDPFDAHLPQSESYGDRLSTMAVVNEGGGSINGEGDQSEYTYMSQAGTLAGQQSKGLTLCTNGCISDDDNQGQDSSA